MAKRIISGIKRKVFTRVLPEVSNLRKLYASKEDTGRIKVLVLNESSMPIELSGKKINTPRRSFFLNKRSMILLLSKGHKLKMIFHHKQKGKDKLQEEIDAFKEAPKALVKWVPKTTSSSTSSSTTTTPRIPIKMVWIPKKKN